MINLLITSIHLAAIGILESSGDNFAVGTHGEVSQYQIMPKLWFAQAGTADPHDPKIAFITAKKIWQQRVDRFERLNSRQPTIEELACLWHAPSNWRHMNDEEKDYCARFRNLIELTKSLN